MVRKKRKKRKTKARKAKKTRKKSKKRSKSKSKSTKKKKRKKKKHNFPENPTKGQRKTISVRKRGGGSRKVTFEATGKKGFGAWKIVAN